MIDYSPLWKLMDERKISQYYLIQNGIAGKTIYNMKRNCYISTSTVEKLCKLIDCTPNDIMKFIPENNEKDT
ncbi:MAG TPA: Cro/Cl family transcriptional regulator [Lachnospiraceae bacterium]|nr:Cro/Cl family transcriptional regulator [Lachnospiraceae bacterium]